MNTRLGKAEAFRRMVAQIAYKTWMKIPRQHQTWIAVDDLIEDGMFKAYQIATGKWRDESRSSLSTSIYNAVRNHLHNEYIVKYGSEMRFASLEAAGIIDSNMKYKRKKKGNTPVGLFYIDDIRDIPIELPQLSTSEETIYNNVLTHCFVVPVLGKIYQEASSKLREEMVHWFLQQREKIQTASPKFRRAVTEFRSLSEEYNLTYYDCQHLIHSPRCMNLLSHELLHVPYDLNHPAPAMDKEL